MARYSMLTPEEEKNHHQRYSMVNPEEAIAKQKENPSEKEDKRDFSHNLKKAFLLLGEHGPMRYAPEMALGVAQGVGDIGASLGNLLLEGKKVPRTNEQGEISLEAAYKIPHPDLSKYKRPGFGRDIAYLAGLIGAPGAAEAKLYGKLTRLKELKGLGKFAGDIQHGAVAGYLGGEGLPGGREAGAAVGGIGAAGAHVVAKGYEKGKTAITQALKDAREGKLLSDRILNYKGKEKASAEAIVEKKNKASSESNAVLGELHNEVESLEKKLKTFAPNEASKAKDSLKTGLKDAYGSIKKEIKKQYNSFFEAHGKEKIEDPIPFEDLKEKFRLQEGIISKKGQQLVDKVVGRMIKTPAVKHNVTGIEVEVPSSERVKQAKPKVKQYVKLSRQLKKEAADYNYRYQNKHIAPELAEEYGGHAKKLNGLAAEIDAKLQQTLGNNFNKLKAVNENFVQLQLPFRHDPDLKNAVKHVGKITKKNFHTVLNEKGINTLKDYLFNTNPKMKSILAKHDLRKVNYGNAKELGELLNSDQGRDLPKHVQDSLGSLEKALQSKKGVKSLVSKIQAHDLTRNAYAHDLNLVLKQHPELKKPFESLHLEQDRHRKIRNHLKKMGLTQKQIESQMTIYDKVLKNAAETYRTFAPGRKNERHKTKYFHSKEKTKAQENKPDEVLKSLTEYEKWPD